MPSVRTTTKITYNILPQILRRLPQAAMEIVQETLDEIDATVKQGMRGPKSGRAYYRRGRIHIASAAGEMPAVDTAELIQSLTKLTVRRDYKGYYYTDDPKAPMLEYGTGRGIAPRPFMTPAAERARRNFLRKGRDLESRLR